MATRDMIEQLWGYGVLPVVEIPSGVDPIALVDALDDGGISCIEIALRTPYALSAIRAVRAERPDILLAAGTVLTAEQVDAALDAGAALIVAPGFSPAVVDSALSRGAEILPGVCTPTEIEMGLARGLDTFKFFPAEAAGGVRYLAALAGPYPDIRFLPTGGIDATNMAAYVRLPNVVACGGSWLVRPRLLTDGDLATVRRLAATAAAIVQAGRVTSAT